MRCGRERKSARPASFSLARAKGLAKHGRPWRAITTLIPAAADDRNDDFLWSAVLNLSSAYLLDGWTAGPTRAFLLKLDVPIGIFHGDIDGTTRVEGVHETAAAFKAAGKTNLTVRTYPGLDHDLGWTPLSALEAGPAPFQDAFAFAVTVVRR